VVSYTPWPLYPWGKKPTDMILKDEILDKMVMNIHAETGRSQGK
jgi:hypothetical protein